MGRTRAFREDDIPSVVDLHRRLFPLPAAGAEPLDAYHAYFKEMYFDAPWCDGQPSLVYEDDDGTPIGFLGLMSRQMLLHKRPIRAVITSQFIVEPTRRATLAAIELARTLLSGSQDLTLADEASDLSRKLWEGLGGTTALLYSFYWVRLLRPVEYTLTRWARGRRVARAWLPLCRTADAVARHLPGGLFRRPVATTAGSELDGATLARCIGECIPSHTLRPVYDPDIAGWLLEMLARKPGAGRLRKVLVRMADGEIAGWYVCAGSPGGVGEVVQIGARAGAMGAVLDHLWAQAWREGMVALVGRLDPLHIHDFSARGCLFHHRGHWTLVSSREQELLDVLQRGEAFFTRLEGEWCLRFQVA